MSEYWQPGEYPTNIVDFKKQPSDDQRYAQYLGWIRRRILRVPAPDNIIDFQEAKDRMRSNQMEGGEL